MLLKKKKIDKYSIENTDYTIGQDNVQKFGFDFHNVVFTTSSLIIFTLLVLFLFIDPSITNYHLSSFKDGIINYFDQFFMFSANYFVLFCLVLSLSPYGRIRLGGIDAVPEYSTPSWLSMLFAAGMGIGLMFWGVSEPLAHFVGLNDLLPLGGVENQADAIELALGATMFHWGIHAWAIYSVVALSLAFFAFNKGLPLSVRSIFFPILGDKTWGGWGHLIDILAVIATLFGLATSLGLGAQQAANGISYVFSIPAGILTQMLLILVITIITCFSVGRGIDGGMKVVSNINMLLALLLLLFLFFVSDTSVLSYIYSTIIGYGENFFALSNSLNRDDAAWMQGWSVFYMSWWIAWSPFVGMFIARISKGRTVREFIWVVIFVPTAISTIWMSTFGGIAIDHVIREVGLLGEAGLTDVTLSLFYLLESFPFTLVLSVIAIVLVLIFFITSSDSGSLVVDGITAGGKTDSPMSQRIFWVVIEGAIAATLLWVGGEQAINALQAGVISTSLPFTIILILMTVCLLMGMKTEKYSSR